MNTKKQNRSRKTSPTGGLVGVDVPHLVRQVVGNRRGKPGQLQREIAEALIPIVAKYRREFGTLGQVAGCASMAANESIKMAIYYPPNETSAGTASK